MEIPSYSLEKAEYKDMQELMLAILENFNKVMTEDIDFLISLSLKRIGTFNDDDCSYVVILSEDGKKFENTHQWFRKGIKHPANNLCDANPRHFPWLMAKLYANEVICINKLSDLPPEARAEKEDLARQRVKSAFIVPMIFEGRLTGYIGFKSFTMEKTWDETAVSLLNILGGIIANALHRKRYLTSIKESENYYRTVFENSGAAAVILEADANREWQKLFGYDIEDLLGRKLSGFADQEYASKVSEYHLQRRIMPELAPKKYEIKLHCKNGKTKDCTIFADIIPGTLKSIVSLIDTTEFNRKNRILKSISAVNMAMLHAENEEFLLQEVCEKIVEIGGYRFAWVGFVDGSINKPLKAVAHAGHENGYIDFVTEMYYKKPDGRKPMHYAIDSGEIFICRNIKEDPAFLPWRDEALKRGYRSMVSIPLSLKGIKPIGAIGIYSGEADAFDVEEVDHIIEMVSDLTFGIISMRTKTERDKATVRLEKSLERMKKLFNQTVASLEAVVMIRDPYTAEHQKRVTKLAVAIAEELGLFDNAKKAILIAASLHDIGKMNIPIDILNKPGKITDIEFSLIKSHCQTGYDVIKNIHFPWHVDEIIYQHHERMDGSGYPQGLKGSEIHLSARIIGVADVVEAMSSHRPYRPALGIDKALEEITAQRAVKYDADVVDACLRLFKSRKFEF